MRSERGRARSRRRIVALLGATFSNALLAAIPASAAAPTTDEDVRCLLLSSGYARLAKDEESRRGSAMTGAFFLGRLNGRLSDAALAAAIRAQGKALPSIAAEPLMRACAARAQAAEQAMMAGIKAAQAGR